MLAFMVREQRRKKSREEREMRASEGVHDQEKERNKRVRSIYKNAPPSLFLFLFQAA